MPKIFSFAPLSNKQWNESVSPRKNAEITCGNLTMTSGFYSVLNANYTVAVSSSISTMFTYTLVLDLILTYVLHSKDACWHGKTIIFVTLCDAFG